MGDYFSAFVNEELRHSSWGMITLELIDWLQVANGKVAKQKIFYDPRELAKAFGMS